MDSNQIERIFERMSPVSGNLNRMTLSATAEQWDAYDKGELIQRALPHLTADQREFIMTGITGAEWDEEFKEDEEEAG
jgi:hypothetical protein